MITLEEISLSNPHYQQERELRNRVLLRPIGLPDYSWEKRDEQAWHFVALEENKVLACMLLYPIPDQNNTAQLMQMAVESELQRKGLGKQLLDFALNDARSKGIEKVFCHARENALGFYEKLNFNILGEPFEEVGIRHFKMEIMLE